MQYGVSGMLTLTVEKGTVVQAASTETHKNAKKDDHMIVSHVYCTCSEEEEKARKWNAKRKEAVKTFCVR